MNLPVSQQYFSLTTNQPTTNQPTILSVMAYQPNEQGEQTILSEPPFTNVRCRSLRCPTPHASVPTNMTSLAEFEFVEDVTDFIV
jgi:hypothetical protein